MFAFLRRLTPCTDLIDFTTQGSVAEIEVNVAEDFVHNTTGDDGTFPCVKAIYGEAASMDAWNRSIIPSSSAAEVTSGGQR